MVLGPSFQALKPSGVAESEKGKVAYFSVGEKHFQESNLRQVLGEKRMIRENGGQMLSRIVCLIVAYIERGQERSTESEESLSPHRGWDSGKP